MTEPLRLNRFLAASGVASRRKCDDLIRAGRVTVNGRAIVELGTQVIPDRDLVTVDGERVGLPTRRWVLVLHKPREFLVTASDMRGRKTVMDLVAEIPERVFPVGRLDYMSEGLLLFTNDGELAYRLAHPRFKVEKLYRVEVAGGVEPKVIRALSEGVVLDDGPTLPAEVRVVAQNGNRTVLEIQIREGRKRQIRRMLSLFGHDVKRLIRVRFGPLELGTLESGTWRSLAPHEERLLRDAAGLGAPEGDA